MCNVKSLLTLVVCLLILTGLSAGAARIYVDINEDDQSKTAIWRYDEAGNPVPASGKGGARFVDFVGEQYPDTHALAFGRDGYLYFTTSAAPNFSYKIRRADGITGVIDGSWSVDVGGPGNRGDQLRFAPDGRLYANVRFPSRVWLIDIKSKTGAVVWNTSEDIGDIDFDPQGRAYVSSWSGTVRRFMVSGTTWTQDTSFSLTMPGGAGAWGMAYGPDGYLYVNDYKGIVYRFNASGVRDTTWSALVDVHPSTPQYSGGMEFGPDGALYVAAAHETPPDPAYVVRCTTATPPFVSPFITISGTQIHMLTDICWDRPLAGVISGHVDLQDFNLAKCPVAVKVDLIQGGATVRTETVVIDSASSGSYSITNIDPGTYDVAFRAASWLGKKLTGKVVNSGPNTSGYDVTLISGDPDLDNEVTTTDLSSVLRNATP